MKNLFIFIALGLFFATTASADRFDIYDSDGDGTPEKMWCEDEGPLKLTKFSKAKGLVTPRLSIRSQVYEANDAETLGIKVDDPLKLTSYGDHVGLPIFKNFEADVVATEAFLDLEYFADFAETSDKYWDDCWKGSDLPLNKKGTYCVAKVDSQLMTIFGEQILSLSCSMEVKGTEFPVLSYTRCSIQNQYERGRPNFEIAFLDYFDSDLAKVAVKRLLKNYVAEISTYVAIAKRCSP